jgi:hypothetical protein
MKLNGYGYLVVAGLITVRDTSREPQRWVGRVPRRNRTENPPRQDPPSSSYKDLPRSHRAIFATATWCTRSRDRNVVTKLAEGFDSAAELSGRSNIDMCGDGKINAEEMGEQ